MMTDNVCDMTMVVSKCDLTLTVSVCDMLMNGKSERHDSDCWRV